MTIKNLKLFHGQKKICIDLLLNPLRVLRGGEGGLMEREGGGQQGLGATARWWGNTGGVGQQWGCLPTSLAHFTP